MPKLSNPGPDGLVTHVYTSLREQVFNVAQAEGEPMVRLNRVGNDGTREAVTLKAGPENLADHGFAIRLFGDLVINLTMPHRYKRLADHHKYTGRHPTRVRLWSPVAVLNIDALCYPIIRVARLAMIHIVPAAIIESRRTVNRIKCRSSRFCVDRSM